MLCVVRVEAAANAFVNSSGEPSGETYMTVLEENGHVIGSAAVFSAVGLEHGFVNFRINKNVHCFDAAGKSALNDAFLCQRMILLVQRKLAHCFSHRQRVVGGLVSSWHVHVIFSLNVTGISLLICCVRSYGAGATAMANNHSGTRWENCFSIWTTKMRMQQTQRWVINSSPICCRAIRFILRCCRRPRVTL